MSAWDGIDEFSAVVTTGSFTAGARLLRMSPTHMSRAVSRLEARLQTRLLDRTTRSVRLTDAGRTFFDHCERLIADREEALTRVSEVGEPRGELRVTCSTAMGERFIAPIARRFGEQHPKVSIAMHLTNRVVDIVAEGFDVAVRTGQLADQRLTGVRVATRRFHTCASPAYLEARGRPMTPLELDGHDCLVGTAATWSFRFRGYDHVVRPKGRWRCNSGAAVLDAALAGAGICQLPDFYVRTALADGRLEPVLESYRMGAEPIWAVYPRRRHPSPKIVQFVEMLEAELPAALNA